MSMADQNQKPTTKPCRVCGEDIKLAARKCIHCDSWQDWRGDVGVSTTILSLLIALFSVTTALLPAVDDYMRPDDSSFKFSFQRVSESGFSIFVSNEGKMPGTVGPAVIYLSDKSGFVGKIHFRMLGMGERAAIAVQPKSTMLLNYALSPHQRIPKLSLDSDTTCIVGMKVTNYRNETIWESVDEISWGINCGLLDSLLSKEPSASPKQTRTPTP